ncbi:MAG TPA: nuclear transport factor 2 family protein [Solirubrobacteraceae bacterium]|nr:nuclear transport factor 2 family protein [Solirubrobacteraceae bacterium]HSD81642.1 nuclear transport factor 2 family protein [Solirubrobacteraceae bacterium]
MRLATAALLAALAVAPGAAGCGGGGGREVPDGEQVAAVVRAFARATAAKDYARLCRDILSEQLVVRIQRAGVTCRDALRAGLQDVRDPHLAVGRIVVDGDAATAEVRTTAAGQAPSRDRLRLAREDGRWRIASLGGA